MFNRIFLIITVFILFAITIGCSCGSQKKQQAKKYSEQEFADSLININRKQIRDENDYINSYIARNKLNMKETGTGLRYMIYQNGGGENAKPGQYAKVNYKVTLLDGTECYSSAKKGPQEFRIGQDNVESGLHEGITYMKVGDKAKFILPSHLAHGLVGDDNKIPVRAAIIYDVELLSLR